MCVCDFLFYFGVSQAKSSIGVCVFFFVFNSRPMDGILRTNSPGRFVIGCANVICLFFGVHYLPVMSFQLHSVRERRFCESHGEDERRWCLGFQA
jgi:hypothetical protein